MDHLRYMQSNSSQSLEEGIEELRKAEMENDAAEDISPELQIEINEHDAIHALFACSTDLTGEILAHVWTVFGTTMKMDQMKKVNAHGDHKEALKEIGHGNLLKTWLSMFPKIIRTIIRAKRMKQKFPVSRYEEFLDRGLDELRKEYGIRLS